MLPMSLELVSILQEILATPFIIPLLFRHTQLQAKFPVRYENSQLRDRLFQGMLQHLRDSVQTGRHNL